MKAIFLILSIGIIFYNYTQGIGKETDLTTWFLLIWVVCLLIDLKNKK